MITKSKHFLKPELFTINNIVDIISKYYEHNLNDIAEKILSLALIIHTKNTSTVKINEKLISKKIMLTKKAFTTPYAINIAISKIIKKLD